MSSTVTPVTPGFWSGISSKAKGAALAGAAAHLVVGVVFTLILAKHHGFGGVAPGIAAPCIIILTTLFGAVVTFAGAWIPKHVTPAERAAALELIPVVKALAPALLALADRVAPKIVTTTVEIAAPTASAPAPAVNVVALLNELSQQVGPILETAVTNTVNKYVLPAAA